MTTDRPRKTLVESDSPVFVDPATVTTGYLVIPMKFVSAIGADKIGRFVGDTLSSAWPVLWSEVRRCQPDLVLESFCIPDGVPVSPGIGIEAVDEIVDKDRFTIVIMTFQLRLPGEQAVSVCGGFCFPEDPARLLFPSKGKLLSISERPQTPNTDISASQTEVETRSEVETQSEVRALSEAKTIDQPVVKANNRWWQFWK
jgi:hypothetical protein